MKGDCGGNAIWIATWGRFLKVAFECHACRGTLDSADFDVNAELGVRDLGWNFSQPCPGRRREQASDDTSEGS